MKTKSSGWAVFAAILLMSCSSDPPPQQNIIRPVRYQQVFLAGGEQSRTLSGISKAGTESKLSFRVGGIVET